ncbi:hypothetical protein [Nocardiopsis protaetiae]|uniref:hypothetical protein n=1 Tax=Nocardiopsis protaetiae TaxID=3382270 RepID=UPI00387B1F6B
MNSPSSFLYHPNWCGGSYELAIETGTRDDASFEAFLQAVWGAAGVQGCYGRKDLEPEEQVSVPCTAASLAEFHALRGRVRLPGGIEVVCHVMAVRSQEWGGESDWLDFGIPMGALEATGLVSCGRDSYVGSPVLNAWFGEIGTRAFAKTPFRLGLIGFETSGCTDFAELGGRVPETSAIAYLMPGDGGLGYHPVSVHG